jgi:hypothetical protein
MKGERLARADGAAAIWSRDDIAAVAKNGSAAALLARSGLPRNLFQNIGFCGVIYDEV